jgi:hypothetical protein
MAQNLRRRVSRLESLVLSFSRANRERNQQSRKIIESLGGSFEPIASVCLLTLHGAPRIDESLLHSWDRVRKSAAWQMCRKKHPDFGEYGREDQGEFNEYELYDRGGIKVLAPDGGYIATPFEDLGVMYIARYFRKYFLPELPGNDEGEKISAVLAMSPPWLMWFTNANVHAEFLGLAVPDLTEVRRFAREELHFGWLSVGPFEQKLRADGLEDWFDIRRREFKEKSRKARALPDYLTPRERARALRLMDAAGAVADWEKS